MLKNESVKNFTAEKIQRLLSMPDSAARASLARLRHGIGHIPGEIPDLWGEYLLALPEELAGKGEPSYAEWAIYTALTMFALHQQGIDRKISPMHCYGGNSLGAAARLLIKDEEDRERVSRRFYPVAVSSDMKTLSYYLRNLVTLLKSEKIPLDYVRLASDLYFIQLDSIADKVRLCWGEDFCRIVSNENSAEKGN